MTTDLSLVLSSTLPVVENAEHVRIGWQAIDDVAKILLHEPLVPWDDAHHCLLRGDYLLSLFSP